MPENLLQKIKNWRMAAAQNEGVELFRVLPNKVIEDIVRLKPKTKEELLTLKGIRERKFEKYGRAILSLINEEQTETTLNLVNQDQSELIENKPYSVSDYLNLLNNQLRTQRARIQGEISSLDLRENYLIFALKDKKGEGLLNCFMWANDYELCGLAFEIGLEIIVEGFPEVYKPSGRLSLRVSTAEVVGQGALKKIYDQLKKKLENEGLFASERKKPLPELPQKIGLITSKQGAVIHDFLTNLGRYGYQIKLVNSRVEGQIASRDLLAALEYFKDKDIDVLVIIRGGGSLESLQAFNNETLVRKITNLPMPVICGIGHEKDVPLASMAADLMVSTPTAVTVALNKSWEKALNDLHFFERDILYQYQEILVNEKHHLEMLSYNLRQKAEFVFKKFEAIRQQLKSKLTALGYDLKNTRTTLNRFLVLFIANFQKNLNQVDDYLNNAEKRLKIVNPLRLLNLGYCLTSINGIIIKSVKQAKLGDKIDIQVADGKIESEVNNIINNN